MNVLITGGAGGLGRALAVECADRGFNLFLTDIDENGLKCIKSGIENMYGVTVHIKGCDITKRSEVAEMFASANRLGFALDMVLNVAGFGYEGEFKTRDYASIDSLIKLNIEATLSVTHEALQHRKSYEKPYYIAFIASMAAMQPIPLKATYAASKKFVLNFAYALREELRRENAYVTAVCPGGLATTADALNGIQTQGFWGSATTNRLEVVARKTVSHTLNGKMRYIPGFTNNFLTILNIILPTKVTTKLLYNRWVKAQDQWLDK